MDRLKEARRPLRGQLTKAMNDSTAILDGDNADKTVLEAKMQIMKTLAEELFEKDEQVATQMLDDDVTDADQDQEYDEVMRYKEAYAIIRRKIEKFLDPVTSSPSSEDDATSEAASFVTTKSKSENSRNFKLPRIELKKFNGDLKQWLGWWSQFKKIHEDEGMDDSDKFQYLANSMEAGTEAAELVDGYPPTAENYAKVMEALEERFGREDLLLQVYLRELLTLVISNVTSGNKIPLASLYLKLESHLRSLAALNLSSADPATWLFPLVESSLCEDTLRAWQRSALSKTDGKTMVPPKTRLDLLMEFIKTEVRSEQQISLAQSGFQTKNGKASGKKNAKKDHKLDEVATVAGLSTGQSAKCAFCEKNHDTDRCVSILSTSPEDRRNIVKEKKLCFQCLRSGHNSKNCRAVVKCAICGGKHYPVVCTRSGGNRDGSKKDSSEKHPQEDPKTLTYSAYLEKTAHNSNNCSGNVLLNTVWVTMVGGKKPVRVRLVGDNCSQRSYIRTSALNKIKREKIGEEWLQNIVFGGQTTKVERSGKYLVQLCHQDENKVEPFDLLEKNELCGKLPQVPYGPWITELKERGVNLNDIGTGCEDIDILIGNDHWGKLLTTAPIIKLECGLYAQHTIFGWTLGGRLPKIASNVVSTVTSLACASVDLTNLWSLEAIGIHDEMEKKTAEQEESEAQSHFDQTVKRDANGRYVVALPWKYEDVDLPVNKWQAEKRLRSSTYKLKKMGKWKDYDMVFRGWLQEGLISTVKNDKDEGHYLPHRPVFKNSSSTPVRPVYDASCRLPNQMSLNDCLYKGPNLLELIPSLLLRFRENNVGVTADIRKAFQMVKVREEDKKFQKFLWWEDEACTKVKVYMHDRVVFGMNCSPFLLGATINHHLSNMNICTDTVSRLKKSWYVDNCILSLESMEQYQTFKEEATTIMKSAGMDLRQWAFTCDGESEPVSRNDNLEKEDPADCNDQCLMILGLVLDRKRDGLSCEIKPFELTGCITKRKILSVASQVFDPLGFLCPTTLQPKLILQQIWIKSLGWDDPLPEEISAKFMEWVKEAALLREIWIPRHFQLNQATTKEIHVFVDASILSYACVIYMRTEVNGIVKVEFLIAKTRLAPIKGSTIPRLELMACLLGLRVFILIMGAIDMVGVKVFFWCDSTTALAWIQRDIECGVFVNNRRKEIRRSTEPSQWAHVPGIHNPADLPSRGCSPRQLVKCQEWIHGPAWLRMSRENWPVSNETPDEDEICKELRKTSVCASLFHSMDLTFSSYEKNVNVWGWVYRYIRKLKGTYHGTGNLSIMELREGEKLLLSQVQRSSFPDKTAVIGGIQVKVDKGGLLRVVTKITNRVDKENFIAPILLPGNHPITESLIMSFHRIHCHAGIQVVMSKMREKYWIIHSRRTISRVLKKCAICRRYDAKAVDVPPAPLPEKRVKTSEPFETTGVDLAGPLFLRDGSKVWIVVFTCAVYRCIYLDLVISCSTEAFLESLERFISVHGRPNTIFSDNGTNFVGSDNLFSQLEWKSIEKASGVKRIRWIFNPPTAAWWGGFWERLIREVKNLLRRMLGKARLTYDQLRTCMANVTSTLNDRPLTALTEDSNDLIPLTPSMFIRGRLCGYLPETEDADSLTSAYRKMKSLQLQIQDRFRKEYLAMLVQRGNEKACSILSKGDVVLVGADNKKRFEWPLGIIVELIPGRDGNVRVARVKTKSGIITRPLQRLYPLEIGTSGQLPKPTLETPATDLEEDKAESTLKTKFGRVVKSPSRYGQCLSFIV